jgi:hypothetical protein
MVLTDEQLEAVKYFCGNLEFEECFGNIESFLVGEKKPQSAKLKLTKSFGEQAVQQVFRSLAYFECLTELTVKGVLRSERNASYILNLDADCARSIIAASTCHLQTLVFEKCDFDDVSWQNLCQGVAHSNATLERLIVDNVSVPGWRGTLDDVNFEARANTRIERTHQMLVQ